MNVHVFSCACVCFCVCVSSEAWSWFGLALRLVQSDNSDVYPGGLYYCSSECACAFACVLVHELVFLHVPAASLLAGNAGNALTPPLVLLAQPTPEGH